MSGYVKIYGSILGSSVWGEPPTTRILWITMLAMADQFGKVEASVGGLARFANITPDECRVALDALSSPDPDSKSPEFEGRRVEKAERGWLILNYAKYREMRTPKQVADATRQAEWRDKRDTSHESQEIATTSSASASSTDNPSSPKKKRTHSSNSVSIVEAGELINKINALAVRMPQGAMTISRVAVGALGDDVGRAYDAIGGSKRFVKDDDYVLHNFRTALAEVRQA